MYKAMHQSMRSSEKLADLSDFAYRVWSMGVVASDMVGRLTANPKKFFAEVFPMTTYEEAKILSAFNELKASKLAHFYEVDGKPYMVFHDHDEHNKGTKNLRNIRPVCPPPSPSICFCVTYAQSEESESSNQGLTPGREEITSKDGEIPTAVPSAVPTAVRTTGVYVQDPSPVLVPVHALEGDSKGEPKESVRFLAVKWNKGPGLHLNVDKAIQHIQAAVDVGVDPQAIDVRFSDHPAIKGLRIWEGLEPLRPRGGVQMPTMDEIIKSASKVGAR